MLQNNGTLVLNKPSGSLHAAAANAQIVNTGTLEHQAGSLNLQNYSGVQLVNQGTIRKTTDSSVSWEGILFTQTDGALLIEGGTLSATQTLNLQGGRLGGHNATLQATLNNTGATIDLGTQDQPVGILTLNGNWTQGADATMRVHLAGTDNSDINAPQYDQLLVVGASSASGRQVALDGELQVASADGYTPNVGDTYDIILLTSGLWTRTGTFSRVRGIGLLRCYTFAVEYLSDRVRLHVAGTGGGSGDINGDGCVDDADLLMVLFAFGQQGSELPEDVTCDGVVDDADLLIVLFEFGSGC